MGLDLWAFRVVNKPFEFTRWSIWSAPRGTRAAYPRADGPSVWRPIGELAKEYSVSGERHTLDAVSDVVETRSSAPPTGERRRAMNHIMAGHNEEFFPLAGRISRTLARLPVLKTSHDGVLDGSAFA
jgi:hypothetical protein